MEEKVFKVVRYDEGWQTLKVKAATEEDALRIAETSGDEADWDYENCFGYQIVN